MAMSDAERRFRGAAKRVTDLVFTEGMEYFDALPAQVERELGTPLAALSDALEEGRAVNVLLPMAELVEGVADGIRACLPAELGFLISSMRDARIASIQAVSEK